MKGEKKNSDAWRRRHENRGNSICYTSCCSGRVARKCGDLHHKQRVPTSTGPSCLSPLSSPASRTHMANNRETDVFQDLRSTADHADDIRNASEIESLCLNCRQDVSIILSPVCLSLIPARSHRCMTPDVSSCLSLVMFIQNTGNNEAAVHIDPLLQGGCADVVRVSSLWLEEQ